MHPPPKYYSTPDCVPVRYSRRCINRSRSLSPASVDIHRQQQQQHEVVRYGRAAFSSDRKEEPRQLHRNDRREGGAGQISEIYRIHTKQVTIILCICSYEYSPRWLSGRTSDLRYKSREFEARPRRCCATTLSKLFTPYCLCPQAV